MTEIRLLKNEDDVETVAHGIDSVTKLGKVSKQSMLTIANELIEQVMLF